MILILGSTGYIGSEFIRKLTEEKIPFKTASHSTVFDPDFITFLDKIDFVINASGYTGKPNVDKCEYEKDKCIFGNVIIPTKIVEACKQKNIPYGHVSSGCIYTGCRTDTKPFTEEDEPNFTFKHNNCSFYSGTKALAEEIVLKYKKSYIWRLRIPFDEENNPRNYISKLLNYNKLIDFTNSVSHRKDYVKVCIDSLLTKVPYGIYNVVNTGTITTKYATEMIKKYISKKDFQFFENEDDFYKTAAKTPISNCVLDNTKLLKSGIKIRTVEEAFIDSLTHWKH